MPINPEALYEDSYQKRERLEAEIQAALDEAKNFARILKKDAAAADRSYKAFSEISDQIDRITEQEDGLREELKNMVTELDNLPEDDKSRPELEEKIDRQRDKITEAWNSKDDLRQKQLKFIKQENAEQGDVEGTIAVIEMKMQKVQELIDQLEELDK